MFVADFIGSPPMNFLHFEAGLQPGTGPSSSATSALPYPRFANSVPWGRWCWACVPSTSCFPTPHAVRGRVFGAEYLGTTQIVTVETEQGRVKARLALEHGGAGRRDGGLGVPLRLLGVVRCANRFAQSGPQAMGTSAMANVALRHVSKRFGHIEAVRDLSLRHQ